MQIGSLVKCIAPIYDNSMGWMDSATGEVKVGPEYLEICEVSFVQDVYIGLVEYPDPVGYTKRWFIEVQPPVDMVQFMETVA